MPIISPLSITQALRSRVSHSEDRGDLRSRLDASGLAEDEVLNSIAEIMRGADTSSARLSAAKVACELHGLLETDAVKPIPVVNIVIQDCNFGIGEINPILLPREINLND
jgi:hypothetical protein